MEAKRVCALFFVLAIWAVEYADCASHHGHSHAPAPAPSVDCSSLILNMADCLSFVSNGSTAKKPEGTCCSGLGTVLKAGPQCLCEAFKSSAQLGVVLDVPKALSLPTICKLPVSKATDCGLTAPPTAAPALSPGSSTTGGTPTGSSPSSSSKSSASSPIPVSAGVLAIGLAVVSFFSF